MFGVFVEMKLKIGKRELKEISEYKPIRKAEKGS